MEKTALDKARAFLSETKDGAIWLAMVDINDLVNYSAIARQYFNKSSNWLLQRLHGNVVNGKPATFKPMWLACFLTLCAIWLHGLLLLLTA